MLIAALLRLRRPMLTNSPTRHPRRIEPTEYPWDGAMLVDLPGHAVRQRRSRQLGPLGSTPRGRADARDNERAARRSRNQSRSAERSMPTGSLIEAWS